MEENGYPLSAKAQAMMLYLIMVANKYRKQDQTGAWSFPLYIEVSNTDLMEALNISRVETLKKIREELAAEGYIFMTKGAGNHSTAYVLLMLRPAERERLAKSPLERDKLERIIAWSRDRIIAQKVPKVGNTAIGG